MTSYEEGLTVGRNWKMSYMPSGPFVCDEETRAKNKEWKEGFIEGLKKCQYKKLPEIIELNEKLGLVT